MSDIVRELRDSADGWDDCGPAYEGNSDMERRAADEIERLRVTLRQCAEAPHSGWTIAQALAGKALGDE